MKQYLDLLHEILVNGVEKESGRENMPNTLEISKGDISMDLSEGFPLLTTKKMFWKGIVHELLWFLRGETNIKYLVDNGVNIWNGDAYRWYLKWWEEAGQYEGGLRKMTMNEFVGQIKEESNCEYRWSRVPNLAAETYTVGDLGKVYGYQWRNQNGVDQIADILRDLKKNPYGRYKILDAWNKADFSQMALPPCHLMYQFIVRPMTINERLQYKENLNKGQNPGYELGRSEEYYESYCDNWDIPKYYLDLNMYQRSCDTFLGVPFNLASMSLLLMIFAKTSGMVAGVANWIGGHTHIYTDHIPVVGEQVKRDPLPLPTMKINKELNGLSDIESLTIDDFELIGYECHDKLKAELFTGLKKK